MSPSLADTHLQDVFFEEYVRIRVGSGELDYIDVPWRNVTFLDDEAEEIEFDPATTRQVLVTLPSGLVLRFSSPEGFRPIESEVLH